MNSRESIPPHRFTVSEDELGLAEIQAILAVIDDGETRASPQYEDATKCVEECKTRVNEVVQRFKDKTDLMTKDKFIEMVKQICDEWKTLIEIKRENYYSTTKKPMPKTDAFSSLKKEVQSIADNTVTLADTMWPATALNEGNTAESKGKEEPIVKQKGDKSKAATHDTDKQPEAAARILHYHPDKLQIKMQGSQRPQSNAKLNDWVQFGTDVFTTILTHPEWQLEEAGYKEVVQALFKYTDNQHKDMITHEQFAAMAYAGLRHAYRYAQEKRMISAGGHGESDGSPEENYNNYLMHHSAADFKLGSNARPVRTELVVGGALDNWRQWFKEKIQKEKEEEQEELMKDFRVPIWDVLLNHGRTINRSFGKEHASNISKAIVTTEILQQPYPVHLEHVTRMFKVFVDKFGNHYEQTPDNLAHTMKIQAVTSYFQLNDFLDDQKKSNRSHEICAIIEQTFEWHDKTPPDEAENNITGFWNSCHAFEKTIKSKMSEQEKEKVIDEMKRRHKKETAESTHAAKSDKAVPDAHKITAQHSHQAESDNKETAVAHQETEQPSHASQNQEAEKKDVTADVLIHHHHNKDQLEQRLADKGHDVETAIQDQIKIIAKGLESTWLKTNLSKNFITGCKETCAEADSQQDVDHLQHIIFKNIQLKVTKNQISLDYSVTLAEKDTKIMRLQVQAIDKQIKFTFINMNGNLHDVIPASITMSQLEGDFCTLHLTWKKEEIGLFNTTVSLKEEPFENVAFSPDLCALLLMIDPKNGTEDKHSLLKIVGSQVPVQYRINYM